MYPGGTLQVSEMCWHTTIVGVDLGYVWQVIEADLPKLKRQVQVMLNGLK